VNAISLFAGIGGFDLALEQTGHTVTDQVEIDRHARTVLARRFKARIHEDIHDYTPETGADIVVGGFPCQNYSVAGRRGGLAGDRGALWWQMHRVVAEGRPTWVVGENVPGLLSSNDGRDFRTIIGSLVELGYGVCWRVLDAQYFRVAQRRRRVFIVGHSGGVPRPEVLALAEGCLGDSPPRRETGTRVAALTANGVGAGSGPDDNAAAAAGHLISFNWQTGGNGWLSARSTHTDALHVGQVPAVAFSSEPGVKQQTYLATAQEVGRPDDGEAQSAHPGYAVRRLTPLEAERLQGFPDGWTEGQSDIQRYRQLGNAVAVPVVRWIFERMAVS